MKYPKKFNYEKIPITFQFEMDGDFYMRKKEDLIIHEVPKSGRNNKKVNFGLFRYVPIYAEDYLNGKKDDNIV